MTTNLPLLPLGVSLIQDSGGWTTLRIDTPLAEAEVALHGAQVLHWQPRHSAHPVLWVAPQAVRTVGSPLRGGIPLCWPWFGPAAETAQPAHGWVRTQVWQLVAAQTDDNHRVHLTLQAPPPPKQSPPAEASPWNATRLTLNIVVGETLHLALTTAYSTDSSDSASSASPVLISEALHSYFSISDVAQATVTGLAGCPGTDKLQGGATTTAPESIRLENPVDCVYAHSGDALIQDTGWQRQIRVSKSSSASTIVWNPGEARAAALPDMAQPNAWRGMVCVEAGNGPNQAVKLAPHQTHTLAMTLALEPLNRGAAPQSVPQRGNDPA